MKDKFINFVSFGIYKFEQSILQSSQDTQYIAENLIKLELSRDKFNYFCKNIGKTILSQEIDAIIYDEGIIRNSYDIAPIKNL